MATGFNFWYLKVHLGVSRYRGFKVSQGISRYIKASNVHLSNTSRYIIVSQGISRYFKVYQGISRHIMYISRYIKASKVYQGISRYRGFKVSQGISRYINASNVYLEGQHFSVGKARPIEALSQAGLLSQAVFRLCSPVWALFRPW
jgi:hypothetical protein